MPIDPPFPCNAYTPYPDYQYTLGYALSQYNPFQTAAQIFNLYEHLEKQRKWSEETFGPPHPESYKGVVSHIRKELDEIEKHPTDIMEYVDVIILALDGAWRSGHSTDEIIDALVTKQQINENRKWPDWRLFKVGEAIEHVRENE